VPGLQIGEYARATWLTEKALRLYGQRGLLEPATVDPRSGYRIYDEAQVEEGRLVALLRRFDMPLALVAEVLAAQPAQRAELIAQFQRRRDAEHARTRELGDFLARAVNVGRFDGYQAGGTFDVCWRHVSTQRVWRWHGQVTARELPTAIAIGIRAGLSRSRAPGSPFVRYLDAVGWDAVGRIEVCVPDAGGDGDLELPAHDEAFVALSPEAAQFPVILGAYEAVELTARDARRRPAPPFREVYPAATDPGALADVEALNCEVALPLR
jgi:DNA-binding transcriptional MerR regulator